MRHKRNFTYGIGILAIMICLIAVVISISGFPVTKDALQTSEQEEDSELKDTVQDAGGSTANETEAERDLKQRLLIAEQKDIWVNYMDFANDQQQYTISDLDGNGRLEVIVSSMGGTGSYTYTRYYEVNESFDELIECTTDFSEGDSQPDLMINSGPGLVYQDAEGSYHYVIQDFLRAGIEYYDTIYSLTLREGHVSHQVLAQKQESYATGSSVVEWRNAEGEKITESEYLSIAQTIFAGMTEWNYNFDWRDLDEIADSDTEEIYGILSKIQGSIGYENP